MVGAMATPPFDGDRFHRGFVLLLVIAVTALFLRMIRPFLTALLLAAIFSGMIHPFYERLVGWCRGHRHLASGFTVTIVLFLIVLPLLGFLGVLANEAFHVSQQVLPWVERNLGEPQRVDALLDRLPFMERLEPYRAEIAEKARDLVEKSFSFVVDGLAATGRQTAWFLFFLFVMLYSMFFFLIDGGRVLDRILWYVPLRPEDEDRMVEKFVSVTRATLKGTIVVGIVQGTLAGAAFAVAGLEGALFWGTIMFVLSVVPGIGAAFVWIPASIYLLATGRVAAGLALGAWCAAVVSTVDNVLRPWLVGRDTQMPDLLVLLGTLGGLFLFGAVGIIIGPIIAAIFITVWEIYGSVFREALPATTPMRAEAGEDEGNLPDP